MSKGWDCQNINVVCVFAFFAFRWDGVQGVGVWDGDVCVLYLTRKVDA